MAFLKNSVVAGDLRVTGTIFGDANLSSINANNTGLGTNGQILTSTGTGIAWSSSVAPSSHSHAASDITSGILAIARGGTGLSASPSMLTNLGSATAANVLQASPRPGVTGTLGAANGGTGKTTLKDSANALINALDTGSSNLTANDYVITQYVGGGTTTTTYHRRPASAIRVGGLLTARKLKVALGSTTDVTFDGTADQTSIPISGTLGIANGGTGATTAAAARTNLGLGTLATKSSISNHSVTTPTGATSRTADVAVNTTTVNSITAVGTLPSLTVTATDVVTGGTTTAIPNISKKTVVTGVTKKTVVTGGTTTAIPNISKKTVVTSATAAKATYSSGVLTISDGSVTTGDSVTVGTAIKAYTSLTTGDSVTVTTGDSVTVGTAINAYTALTTSSIGSASGWSAGTLPTKGSNTTVATGIKTQPTFTVTTTTTTLSHTVS